MRVLSRTDQSAIDGDVLEFIRSRLTGFSPAERRVADVVLAAPREVLQMSAARLAETSGSSVGSVVRFCHTLGLPGYQEFKLRVAQRRVSVAVSPTGSTAAGNDSAHVVHELFTHVSSTVFDVARAVDVVLMDRIADLLLDAQRILIVAAGTSSPFAADLAHRLITIGLPVSQPTDAQTQQAAAQRLREGDVCFAVSHSGTTAMTLESVRIATNNRAAVVALTSFATSPLSTMTQSVLVAGSRRGNYWSEEMASRLIHLAVLNALCVLIEHRQQTSTCTAEPRSFLSSCEV